MRSTEFVALHIPIPAIKQGESHFSFRIPSIGKIKEGVTFPDGVSVEAEVQTVEQDFLVDLKVAGEGAFVCDRCGKDFKRRVDGTVQTLFSYGTELRSADEDVKNLQPADRFLDITQDAQDALALVLPVKVLCSDECKGLCPVCGADYNIETCECTQKPETPASPWDALKQIRFD